MSEGLTPFGHNNFPFPWQGNGIKGMGSLLKTMRGTFEGAPHSNSVFLLAPAHSWYSLPQRVSHLTRTASNILSIESGSSFRPPRPPVGALNINLPDPQDCMEFHNPPPEANTRMYLEHPISLNHKRCPVSSFRFPIEKLSLNLHRRNDS